MPLPFHRRRLDPDAADFCRRSGATDRAAINAFVKGVKELGLWDKMVCWPLRSSQNAGSGNTVYSLGGLGTFDGTRVNDPAWTADGITYDGVDDSITTSFTLGATQVFCGVVGDMPTSGGGGNFYAGANSAGHGIYWVNPRSGFGGQYRYGSALGQYVLLAENSTSGVHMWSTIGGVGLNTKGYRSTALLGTAGTISTEPSPNALSTGLVLGRNTGAYQGTAAFAFIIHAAPSSPDAFYSLYKSTLGTGLGLPDYDPSTIEYANRSGATDLANIDAFVRGVKDLGLWDNMVCWPLRSSQNAGTGDTVYSLGGLGTFNGTRVNGPAWTADGIDTSPSNAYIEMPQNFLNGANSVVGQTGSMLAVFANFSTDFGLISNRGASGNFWTFGTRNAATQIFSVSNATGGTNQIVTKAGLNTNNLQFSSWRMDGSGNRYTTRWNGTNAQSAVVSGGTASSRTNFQIGRENLSQFALKCAFCMTVEGVAISNEQHDALEALYKSTLGTGLGLP